MNSFRRPILFLTLLVPLFSLFSCATSSDKNSARIVLLYVSDLHSQIKEQPNGSGGYDRLKAYVDAERMKAGPQTDVLLVMGGDLFGKGRIPCRETKEVPCADLIGEMKPDVIALGNGEMKISPKRLSSLAKRTGGAWVSSILANGFGFIKPYYEYAGRKSKMRLKFYAWSVLPEPDEYLDRGAMPFRKNAMKMKPALNNILIWHDERSTLKSYAKSICKPTFQAPLYVLKAHQHIKEQGVFDCLKYVEAGAFVSGVAKLVIDQNYKVQSVSVDELNGDKDPQMSQKIASLYKKYGKGAEKTVLKSDKEFSREQMGDYVAMSYRRVSKADVSLVNSGAVKMGLPKGNVDWETVVNAVPYNNRIYGMDISKQALEKALCKSYGNQEYGSKLYMSGMSLENAGTEKCRLRTKTNKSVLKLAIDEFLIGRSQRWVGLNLKGKGFRYGLETHRALELALQRYGQRGF